MSFHKHSFPIFVWKEKNVKTVEVVKGWANEDYTIGFHKLEGQKLWSATDLLSGRLICRGETRDKCVKIMEEKSSIIEEKKKSDEYVQMVRDFEFYLSNKLREL